MSEAVTTTGIKVRRALAASPTVFTDIGEIVRATPPGFSRNKLESSTHNDGAESYVLGILRQRDGAFSINYVGSNATHASILADILANTKNRWQFLLPSGISYTADGRVQKFEIVEATVDAIQQADVVIAWAEQITPA